MKHSVALFVATATGLAAPALAQTAPPPAISVTGEATVSVPPDQAQIDGGVTSDAKVRVEKKLTDPRINIKTGTRYLRDLINMFPGRIELALAAYNAGEGAVQRAGNQIPNYKETQNYVKTVMQIYSALKPPAPPPPPPESRHPLSRVRPAITGGALNRGNMPSNLATPGKPKSDTE